MNKVIREAKPTDITNIMQVMEAAKKIMRSSGNMRQWGDGYPSEAVTWSLCLQAHPNRIFRYIVYAYIAISGVIIFISSCRS